MADYWNDGPSSYPCPGARPFAGCKGRAAPVGNTVRQGVLCVQYVCTSGCGYRVDWPVESLRWAAARAGDPDGSEEQ